MALAEPIVPVVTTRGVARMRVARPSWGRASLGDRIAIGVFVALILVAILAPVLAPYSPTVSTGTAFAQPFGAGH